jgi:hypothetical protein
LSPTQTQKKQKIEDDDASDPTASSSRQHTNPTPLLPIAGEENTDSDEDSEATISYDAEHAELIIDEGCWTYLTGREKTCANTASFTMPEFHDCPFDVFTVQSTPLKPLTKKQLKARKEASVTDLRNYAKQFREAKLLEYESWKENEVFELVDTRKQHCRTWVTGRWVLTVKHDKEGNFQK